jgi:hypothetical protein
LENVSQQWTPDKQDPDQLLSKHSTEEHPSTRDNLYYKDFAGVVIFILIVACVSIAVIYEP